MNKRLFLIILFFLGTPVGIYAISPESNYILTPDSIGWSYESLQIRTEDNLELNTWIYFPNPDVDKNTVLILANSDTGNMSYFVYHAATLANKGYTVVTFDYRGFGKSSAFAINPSNLYYMEFSEDLKAVVNNISLRFSGRKLGIWALSMGTIITARTYSNIDEKLDFIIGEGFVTDTSLVIDRYQERGKRLILPESDMSYSKVVEKINVPLLIFTASKDEIITTSDVHKLKDKLLVSCKIVEYEGGHLQGFQYKIDDRGFGEWYLEQITSFLAMK